MHSESPGSQAWKEVVTPWWQSTHSISASLTWTEWGKAMGWPVERAGRPVPAPIRARNARTMTVKSLSVFILPVILDGISWEEFCLELRMMSNEHTYK